jgi:hypothetical protein
VLGTACVDLKAVSGQAHLFGALSQILRERMNFTVLAFRG